MNDRQRTGTAIEFLVSATSDALPLALQWDGLRTQLPHAARTPELLRALDEWNILAPQFHAHQDRALEQLNLFHIINFEPGSVFEWEQWVESSHEVIIDIYSFWIEVSECLGALASEASRVQ
jgi:hypothetical protein